MQRRRSRKSAGEVIGMKSHAIIRSVRGPAASAPDQTQLRQRISVPAQGYGGRQRRGPHVRPPVGGDSGSTDIRELLLVFLKVLRAFGVFFKRI